MATKTKKPSSGYTEDWLPLRGIQNNMIITRDNHKVAGVKISPKNIFILDSISQENTLIGLKNFYNMIDFEFWLVVADRPVDISVYMSQMQLLYNETQNPAIRKLIRQDIEKGQTFIHNNIVDTEYYFLFRAKDPELLQKRVRMMINGLATCGLNASQASNSDLRVILDTKEIPEKKIKELGDNISYKQLSLVYDGEFNFTATLTISVGKEHKGKYGNLYYYNEKNELEFVDSAVIGTNGKVSLEFTHASDYVIVIGENMEQMIQTLVITHQSFHSY